ncbi:tRNA/rRNA methyltransferase [Utexia brackfieldae]|uniref:tRNA/rRNA methyltransferase n=1 Tax=Utexia brackfieldae TaxID=3074108 RepID=UPI00370D521D
MNDNENTTKNKPSVYYAQKKAEPERRTDHKRSGDSRKGDGFAYKKDGYKKEAYKDKPTARGRSDERTSRIETFEPKKGRVAVRKPTENSDSPWQTKIRKEPQQPSYAQKESEPALAAPQRKLAHDEVFVYSENSCKAVFKQRASSIIKAFLTEEMTTKFRDLVMSLAEKHLGYDVVSDEYMTKLTGTPHHGGVCLIVKKRTPLTALDYLDQTKKQAHDCVLAIDDINNPHNLGALIRSAAFFSAQGVILRHVDTLESGAALRVAEGGAEYVQPIRADDMAATLSQFKQQGYRVVALLPCKMKNVPAQSLFDVKFADKTVVVLFQQMNKALIQVADQIVYVSGSDVMPALNISVATGLILAQWQQRNQE